MKPLLYSNNLLEVYLEDSSELEALLNNESLESKHITLYNQHILENRLNLSLEKDSEKFISERYIKKTPGDYKENTHTSLNISVEGVDSLTARDFVKEAIKEQERIYEIAIYTSDHPVSPFFNQNTY